MRRASRLCACGCVLSVLGLRFGSVSFSMPSAAVRCAASSSRLRTLAAHIQPALVGGGAPHSSLSQRPTRGEVARQALKFTYFGVWAKGPSIALALQHSGLDWEGAFPEDWGSMKATTPFRELPVLEVPELGMVGHELAILNYIGRSSSKMGGADDKEFMVSQQLLSQSEDIYQKLVKLKAGLDEGGSFWTDEEEATHNRNFGVRVLLKLLEAFYAKTGVAGGKFTSSGVTVGECKLFSSLHALKLIKADILADYPGLASFYERFAGEAGTKAILEGTGGMPGQFGQYFEM